MIRFYKRNQSGAAFLMSLVMMLVLLNLGIGYLAVSQTETKVGKNEIMALKGHYVAEAGAEHVLADLKNGGGGFVMNDIFYPDQSSTQYMASFDAGTGKIVSGSYYPEFYGIRTVELQLARTFTGAIQVGNNVVTNPGVVTGDVNGNADAAGTIDVGSLNVTGTTTPNNSGLFIPAPTFTDYESATPMANRYSGWPTWTSPPNGDGMYYVNGNLTVSTNFTLTGTLVVTGTLQITQGAHIVPDGDDPAIVAGGNIQISSCSLSYPAYFYGLVYSGGNINFFTSESPYVYGALIAQGDLTFDSITNANFVFDTALNPPYFSEIPGGNNSVLAWKTY